MAPPEKAVPVPETLLPSTLSALAVAVGAPTGQVTSVIVRAEAGIAAVNAAAPHAITLTGRHRSFLEIHESSYARA
jgi:hypothetical protein